MEKPKDVEEYINRAPELLRDKLRNVRRAIKEIAPSAEEKISYGMPYYSYKGRLAYFAYFKHHIGLYIPTPVIENHASDLKHYVVAKGTVRFPLTEKIPLDIVKKLVKARLLLNEKSKQVTSVRLK